MTPTTIVIVNFNSGGHLRACLASVRTHAPQAPVIVVDNGSTDGSEEPAAAADRRVVVFRNTANVGFGRAVNQAAAAITTDTMLLLNPDCRLQAGAVEALAAELEAQPACAIAAPRILNDDGSVQGSVRGHPTLMTGLFGRTTLLTRLFPNLPVAQRNVPVLEEAAAAGAGHVADWVSGACMLIRRSCFETVGGFDPRYFLYWEDADLCRRLATGGYTVRYVPTATVMHTGGGSSRSARAMAIRAFHRSAYTYYATHVARRPLMRLIAWALLHGRCRWKLIATRFTADRHAAANGETR